MKTQSETSQLFLSGLTLPHPGRGQTSPLGVFPLAGRVELGGQAPGRPPLVLRSVSQGEHPAGLVVIVQISRAGVSVLLVVVTELRHVCRVSTTGSHWGAGSVSRLYMVRDDELRREMGVERTDYLAGHFQHCSSQPTPRPQSHVISPYFHDARRGHHVTIPRLHIQIQ